MLTFRTKVLLYRVLWVMPVGLLLVPASTSAPVAMAPFSSGITRFSGNPAHNGGRTCSECHFGGTAPTVTLAGPTLVETGKTYSYTLQISGGQQIAGGLDVSVDAGVLAATDPGTQLFIGEITHRFPRFADSAGNVQWAFDWTAPANPGNVNLYAAGNSVNLNGQTSGDSPDTDQLSITVDRCLTKWTPFGSGTPGSGGFVPLLAGTDGSCTGAYALDLTNGPGKAKGFLLIGFAQISLPFACGNILVDLFGPHSFLFFRLQGAPGVAGAGSLTFSSPDLSAFAGLTLFLQAFLRDPGACPGISLTNAVRMDIG